MPDSNFNSITAIVLAGGKGKRYGGADKGLVIYRGRALVEWVLDALETQVDDLVLSVNRNRQRYQSFGFRTVQDSKNFAAYQGPLAGISAVYLELGCAEQNDYLISSCDSPHLPDDYVLKLQQALDADFADVAVVHDGERLQHLHCLIAGSAMPSLVDFFAAGGRAMHQWLRQAEITEVDFSQQVDCFANLNFETQPG